MLPKKNRLSKDRDFRKVYKNAPKIKGAFLSLRYLANQKDLNRFGVVVSNKIAPKATKRNSAKRKLRHALSGYLGQIKPGYDVILKIETLPDKADFVLEIDSLLKRSRLLKLR